MMDNVGELLLSLILIILCSPILLPSTWRIGNPPHIDARVRFIANVVTFLLLVAGICGTIAALRHLT